MGERQPHTPPSPSLGVSKHTPSVRESFIWRRKKSPIWGMCSDPPRYYNLTIVKPGAPLSPSEERRPGFSYWYRLVPCSRYQPTMRSGLRARDVFAGVPSRELGARRRREISLEPSLLYRARWPLLCSWVILVGGVLRVA